MLRVSGFPAADVSGSAQYFTVTALNADGSQAVNYRGTVDFQSSDARAVLPAPYTFTAQDNGAHAFLAVLTEPGSQSLTATDTGDGRLTGTQAEIRVASPAAYLTATDLPPTATAGQPVQVTVTAHDGAGRTDAVFPDTVHFTSTDPHASLPADYTFTPGDHGAHVFTLTLGTAGGQAVYVSDVTRPAVAAAGSAVAPGAAVGIRVSGFPAADIIGVAHYFTVTAVDAYGNRATGYRGQVHFASTDGGATLPKDYTFLPGDAGAHTFVATLNSINSQSLSATDTADATISGTQAGITVFSPAAYLLASGAPAVATAGQAFNVTVTAKDAAGRTDPLFRDTVHFRSLDPQAVLPADYTFTAADAGSHTFTITLRTVGGPGDRGFIVTDVTRPAITGTAAGVTVTPAAAAGFRVSGFPAADVIGTAHYFTVIAVDAYGNQATGYRGQIRFSSSDSGATLPGENVSQPAAPWTGHQHSLPAAYTFQPGEAGVHTFLATLNSLGDQSLTVTDTTDATVTGTQAGIHVASPAAYLTLAGAPAVATAGQAFTVTVTAHDGQGRTDPLFRDTVHFSSPDPRAVLPADYTFTPADGGSHTFPVSLNTAGGWPVYVSDVTRPWVAATGAGSAVAPGAAAGFRVSGFPAADLTGAAQWFTVMAVDAYGNRATGYRGQVHFASTDGGATLPKDYTFLPGDAGAHTFVATLTAVGNQSLTAADTADGSITGTEAGITVFSPTAYLTFTGLSAVTAAGQVQVTVTAHDAQGRTDALFRDTVHFLSTDPKAGLPADYTFTPADQGSHTFTVALGTPGAQAVAVRDASRPALAQAGAWTAVTPGPVAALRVAGFPAADTAGVAHLFTVTAVDAYGNAVPDYRGTVHFGSDDPQASLPPDYAFTAADRGTHTFVATLTTAGNRSLTAADTASSGVRGSEASILVSPGTAYWPTAVGNTGPVTLTFGGDRFSWATRVSLVAPDGTVLTPLATYLPDPGHLYATFDLTGKAVGSYTVRVENNGQPAPALAPLTVVAGQPGQLQVTLTQPPAVYVGSAGTLAVGYTNTGNVDMPAPLLDVSAVGGALLKLPNQSAYVSELQVLGASPDGPAGVLRPGEHAELIVNWWAAAVGGASFRVSQPADEAHPIDWVSAMAGARPATFPADAWGAIWGNVAASAGSTVGQLRRALAQDATALSDLGEYTDDPAVLLGFEVAKADDSLLGPTTASALDVSAPAPGLALTFGRTFQQPLDGRYNVGALGRGWADSWEMSASADAQGRVTLQGPGWLRTFQAQGDGTYRGAVGDLGVVTRPGGAYLLREADGTLLAFRTDGKFDSVQDPHGNRIQASYDAATGELVRLTHSDGAFLTLSYNAQGRVSQVTDPSGRTVSYSYDADGEHLLSVTGPDGVTQYTYLTGQGAAREHALASVTNPDGTHVYYDYDSQGRLVGQHLDGGAEAVRYGYGTGGTVTVTDATGAQSTLLFNELGQLGAAVDPLGRREDLRYDANHQLVAALLPDGSRTLYAYDAQGNLMSETDPLGHQVRMTYDAHGNLLSFRDARGNTTRYTYSSQGDLLAVTYADGTKNQFSYDPLGNLTESVNARGQALTTQYDGRGLATRQTYADGSTASFTYDARGNLLTATVSPRVTVSSAPVAPKAPIAPTAPVAPTNALPGGALQAGSPGTTSFQYDSADRLVKVSYPDGRSLQFRYDAGGRRTQSVDQSSFTVNYVYDAVGRLSALTDGSGARIAAYTYDAAGNLVRKDLGNGTSTTYAYDAAGELLHLVNFAPDGSVNSRFDYTYDALGQVRSLTTLDGTTTYGYDADGQLTSVTLPGGGTVRYAYDASGNRISVTQDGQTTAYVTNDMNEYTAVGTAQYRYDADGNLVAVSDGGTTQTYAYDQQNQMVGASGPDGTWSYAYDPFGNRTAATHNGARTEYLNDPAGLGAVVAEYDGAGALLAHYTSGLGLTSRVDASGAAAYYDFDALGSAAGLTDAAGRYVNRATYLPFGELAAGAAALANGFTFAGAFGTSDEGGGLLHMGLRDYDPRTGRFTSRDPLGLGGGDPNVYRYVSNQPTGLVDPTGLSEQHPNTPYGPWAVFYKGTLGWERSTVDGHFFATTTTGKGLNNKIYNYTTFATFALSLKDGYREHEWGHVIINNDPRFEAFRGSNRTRVAAQEYLAYARGMAKAGYGIDPKTWGEQKKGYDQAENYLMGKPGTYTIFPGDPVPVSPAEAKPLLSTKDWTLLRQAETTIMALPPAPPPPAPPAPSQPAPQTSSNQTAAPTYNPFNLFNMWSDPNIAFMLNQEEVFGNGGSVDFLFWYNFNANLNPVMPNPGIGFA